MKYEESNPFQIPCILKRNGFKRTGGMKPNIPIHRFDRVDTRASVEKEKLMHDRIKNFEIFRSKDETLKFETDCILCILIEVHIGINHSKCHRASF